MKQKRKPTRKQKDLIAGKNLNPAHWLVFKNLPGEMHLAHRQSNKVKVITLAG